MLVNLVVYQTALVRAIFKILIYMTEFVHLSNNGDIYDQLVFL